MSDSAPLPAFPPSQRCFLDGLALCFAKLDLTDFLSAVVVCKHWRAASLHAPSIGFELTAVARKSQNEEETQSRWTPSVRLLNLVASSYRIHISSLKESFDQVWNLSDLRLLHQLSHLTQIAGLTINLGHFSAQREAFYDFAFPASLQSAELIFLLPPPPAAVDDEEPLQAEELPAANLVVLPGLVGCPALTELSLRAWAWRKSPIHLFQNVHLDLSPLADLRQLKSLSLQGDPACRFGAAEMQPLKRLECLERLTVQSGDLEWIVALCEGAHSLRCLAELTLVGADLTAAHVQALRSLPALTTLEPASMSLPAITLLAGFPHLRLLSITPPEEPPEPLSMEMREALVDVEDANPLLKASFLLPFLTCSALHTLELERISFTEDDAKEMWRLLPAVTSLSLLVCDLPSFHSFAKLPQLKSLVFEPLQSRPCDVKIEHILACKALKSARLFRLGPELMEQLQPLCVIHSPGLTEFHRAD